MNNYNSHCMTTQSAKKSQFCLYLMPLCPCCFLERLCLKGRNFFIGMFQHMGFGDKCPLRTHARNLISEIRIFKCFNIDRFKCLECNAAFPKRQDRKKHIREEHGKIKKEGENISIRYFIFYAHFQ